ncbi:MAG TPA: polysaccharide deacetylase family protein [Urbifossiella sp.]|nr:polysaccharide deacetylase family protein [Urbifossiella sp.]
MTNGPLILAYHSVADPVVEPSLQVRPATLSAHIRWLGEAGYTIIHVEDLCHRVFGGESGERLAAVTFDDGYTDFQEHAWPCLAAHGVGAVTLFVCPEHVGGDTGWNFRSRVRLRHLDAHGLRRLRAAGVRVEAHGLDHRNFCQLDPGELAVRLDRCQHWFREHLGAAARLLAYPYGDYTEECLAAVGERYAFAFAVGDGRGFRDRRAVSRRCVSEFTTRERLLSPPPVAAPGARPGLVARPS